MLVLASASPRRAQILTEIGVAFEVDPSDIAEELQPREAPDVAAVRLAAEKAAAVAARRPGEWILAADTLVFIDGAILGKPADDAGAAVMLRLLSGRDHTVVTGVRLRLGADPGLEAIAWSRVRFAPLSEEEIAWYVATGEPRDKAGAYGVQGLGARFVEEIEGSYTNVMGLPAREVYRLMTEAGDPSLFLGAPSPASP